MEGSVFNIFYKRWYQNIPRQTKNGKIHMDIKKQISTAKRTLRRCNDSIEVLQSKIKDRKEDIKYLNKKIYNLEQKL